MKGKLTFSDNKYKFVIKRRIRKVFISKNKTFISIKNKIKSQSLKIEFPKLQDKRKASFGISFPIWISIK
jgi:hypothetical protein